MQIIWPETWFAHHRPLAGIVSWHGSLLEDKQDATGTLYRLHRYYDPASGRFTQEDPIGLAGGLNVYGFAGGDPVNNIDPFGLKVCFKGSAAEIRALRHAAEQATGAAIWLDRGGCITAVGNSMSRGLRGLRDRLNYLAGVPGVYNVARQAQGYGSRSNSLGRNTHDPCPYGRPRTYWSWIRIRNDGMGCLQGLHGNGYHPDSRQHLQWSDRAARPLLPPKGLVKEVLPRELVISFCTRAVGVSRIRKYHGKENMKIPNSLRNLQFTSGPTVVLVCFALAGVLTGCAGQAGEKAEATYSRSAALGVTREFLRSASMQDSGALVLVARDTVVRRVLAEPRAHTDRFKAAADRLRRPRITQYSDGFDVIFRYEVRGIESQAIVSLIREGGELKVSGYGIPAKIQE